MGRGRRVAGRSGSRRDGDLTENWAKLGKMGKIGNCTAWRAASLYGLCAQLDGPVGTPGARAGVQAVAERRERRGIAGGYAQASKRGVHACGALQRTHGATCGLGIFAGCGGGERLRRLRAPRAGTGAGMSMA